MPDNSLQEWEEYDARLVGHDSPFQSAIAREQSAGEYHPAAIERQQDRHSPFLLGQVEEGEAFEKESHGCKCGSATPEVSSEAESYGEAEGLEEAHPLNFPAGSFGENQLSAGRTCSVGCPEPSKSDLKAIRKKGNPQGAVIERTAGDPSVNLALQLVDYDVNAYFPSKTKHTEALTRISDFIAKRSRETNEPIALTITGSASRTGSSDYNDVLSCKRASCAAENIKLGLSPATISRLQINTSGEGFTRATCRGSDCELGEWRSVLVQVHAPSSAPRPIPVVDPGWDKYTIRCCSFHTKGLPEVLLEQLLKRGLPNIPENLKGRALAALRKGIATLKKQLLKGLPKLAGVAEGFEELLKLFPAQIIQETGVFEIRERDKANARVLVLCYSGFGLRIIFPRANIDQFLDDGINKVSFFRRLPDAVKKQLRESIKKLIPNALKTLVQAIESDSPGPIARFDLKHPRNTRVFEGRVQVGKGVWMPGQVNVEFDSPPWHRPDPIQRPIITTCPGTTCNDSGVQTIVGVGQGLEFFSITAGDLAIASCVCAVTGASETESVSEWEESGRWQGEAETEGETEGETEQWIPESEADVGREEVYRAPNNENESATGQEGRWQAESFEIDPYAAIRPALQPEHATLPAGELAVILGRRPAIVTLHRMLASPEPQLASLAVLLGKAGKRSIRLNTSNVRVSSYLRLLSRLCHEAAEQSEEDSTHSPSPVAESFEDSREAGFAGTGEWNPETTSGTAFESEALGTIFALPFASEDPKTGAAPLPDPRHLSLDAFFDDEWATPPTPLTNPRNVHFNRFTKLTTTTATERTLFAKKPNPLDPRVDSTLVQPELIPKSRAVLPGESYWLFVPDAFEKAVKEALAKKQPPPTARVSVLFGVGLEVNRHGLRSFFADTDDRILIEVGGVESVPEATGPWGMGITDGMVKNLLYEALGSNVTAEVEILAAYSTGYRGLNGTINNSLLNLTNVKKMIFFDCLYRGDGPKPPKGAVMPPKRHPGAPASSAFNTWRAIHAVTTASPSCQVVVYDVTPGGTPTFSDGARMVDIPGATFIKLKPLNVVLKAIILARLMDNGIKDGYFDAARVPAGIRGLIPLLPKRGTLSSGSSAKTPGTIGHWAAENAAKISRSVSGFAGAMKLARTHRLMGWATPDTEFGHDGFLPEFGWEHLAG